ncbi:MAG: DnaD domain protein [Bacilli bacterium]
MLNNSSKYNVISSHIFNSDDYISISKYYQPVIGPVSTLLYISLLNEINNEELTKQNSISKLLLYVNTSIDKIHFALKVLEKAKLVTIYKAFSEDIFIIEVQKPLSKEKFLADINLSKLLADHLGEQYFLELRNEKFINLVNLKEYSKLNFNSDIENKGDDPYLKYFKKLNLDNDISEIEEISEIANINKITKIEIDSILPILVNENVIDLEKFKKAIQIIKKDDYNKIKTITNKKEALDTFDNYDSETYLSVRSNGRTLSSYEKNLIFILRNEYRLVDSVINVLIDYVLLTNDKNLTKNYILTIAASLSRKNFTKSLQAMKYIKDYGKRMQHNKNIDGKIVPDWLKKDLEINYSDGDTTKVDDKSKSPINPNDDSSVEKINIKEDSFDIFSNFEGV